jgi:hypothetical protein
MPRARALLSASIPLLLLGLSGCDGLQIALQEPVASSPPLVIEGGGKTRTMGAITIERTKGGMVTTFSGSAGPWGGEKVKQDFQYETSDGWAGSCAFASGGQTIAGFNIAQNGGMKCTVSKGEQRWELDLEAVADPNKRLIGTYSNGSASVDVAMSRKSANSGLPMFMGYTMSVAGAEVAAVQVVGVRRFWIVDGTPEVEAMRASLGAYLFSDMAVKNATQ